MKCFVTLKILLSVIIWQFSQKGRAKGRLSILETYLEPSSLLQEKIDIRTAYMYTRKL